MIDFANKKVLVFGFGVLGGGLATTNWLLKQGAHVTVTDLKTKEQLKTTLDQIQGDVELKLGGHDKADIDGADIIVANPGIVIAQNEYIQYAFAQNKIVINEASIFFEHFKGKTIAITGTRGKTTTVAWTSHFIPNSIIAGNNPEHQFLKVIDQPAQVAVIEIGSFHLEHFDHGPDIAAITNLSEDHLSRYGTMEQYAKTKANIFKHQTSDQKLILNRDDVWTQTFLDLKPQSSVIYFQDALQQLDLDGFAQQYGKHNLDNLLCAATTAHAYGISWDDIQTKIATLPSIPLRQEIIYQNEKLTIVNDNNSTSPAGGIAAIKRFAGDNTILITGGTNHEMHYDDFAALLSRNIKPEHVIFLSGSATEDMKANLNWESYQEFETLESCLNKAIDLAQTLPQATIVFSPAAKSFEKFTNEFDRGAQFNKLVKERVG